MTIQLAEYLFETAENQGFDIEIISDYSGRSMYGKTTHALVLDNPLDLIPVLLRFFQEDPENASSIPAEIPHHFRQDNMGRQTVIY